ncbi:MAG TPA: hypothetical protein VK442_03445 [Xanthobacteraceae bacterium]|nr:hypothetical protein [Xanthobacteraceae bacterium]
MSRARRVVAVAPALLLVAGTLFVFLFSAAAAQAQGLSGNCEDAAGLAVLSAPMVPWKGAPLRVVFAAEKPLDGELSLIAPDGSVAAESRERHGGPPYFWFAEVAAPVAGTWQVKLTSNRTAGGCGTITREIGVRGDEPPRPHATAGSIWPLRNSWNRATENLFAAWIEKLFAAPLDAAPSWPALHDVLRDRSRNFLFNYLGLGEDEMRIVLRPDCADLPYFLRAYFAFKMGLPFGYASCSRGGGGKPPRCYAWASIEKAEAAPSSDQAAESAASGNHNPEAAKRAGLAASFGRYLSKVADAVQSGAVRTLANDDNTDFYTVPLKQETLRPGTVYADPYGHVMMLVKRVPQSGGAAGIFLAVDGEPDGTVARKRFWRGTFLFAHEPALGSPGFKRFRPVVRQENGALRRLTNAEIAKNPQYGDFSLEQSQLGVEEFYDRMDEVMSPEPLDPLRAMEDAIASLEEQVKTRVGSVENGRKFQNGGHGDATMPDGPAIFATTGAWEDFATPARDFRLLIAIDVVRFYPDRVARRPQRYAMPFGKSVDGVKAELQRVLASELAARKFSYTRSDGSTWTLTLKDVVDRATDFEMAYNLNDCVELRWGAPANSDEASTCKRHAPAAQRAKMTQYRTWFRERHWPARV